MNFNLRRIQAAIVLGLLIGITRFVTRETERGLEWAAGKLFPRCKRPGPFNGWGRRH